MQPLGGIDTGKIKETTEWKTLMSLINKSAAATAIKESMETLYSYIFPEARLQTRPPKSNA